MEWTSGGHLVQCSLLKHCHLEQISWSMAWLLVKMRSENKTKRNLERIVFLVCLLLSGSCFGSREIQEHLKAKSSSISNRGAFRLEKTVCLGMKVDGEDWLMCKR